MAPVLRSSKHACRYNQTGSAVPFKRINKGCYLFGTQQVPAAPAHTGRLGCSHWNASGIKRLHLCECTLTTVLGRMFGVRFFTRAICVLTHCILKTNEAVRTRTKKPSHTKTHTRRSHRGSMRGSRRPPRVRCCCPLPNPTQCRMCVLGAVGGRRRD